MSCTILIAEDDHAYRGVVARYLRRLQFTVLESRDLEQALQHLDRHPVEVVILDIGLGKRAALQGTPTKDRGAGCSGYTLLEIVRSRPEYISVIVLTSLDETIYEVASLNRGADDFVLKTIKMEALGARVQCCLRRVRQLTAARAEQPMEHRSNSSGRLSDDSLIQAGDFQIDIKQRLLKIGERPYVDLTALEARLLQLMACTPGRVFRKQELLELLWGRDAKQTYHSVEGLVKSVRRKIEPRSGKPRYLLNSYGIGYRLNLTCDRIDSNR
jgi:DNA-binding response OmpR family regulator